MQVSNHFRYSLYFKLTVISNLFNFNPKCRYIGGGMHLFFFYQSWDITWIIQGQQSLVR